MKIVTSSLYTKLTTSNTLNTALSGRFYNQVAPSQEVFPYCVFKFINEVPTAMLDTTVLEESDVEFYLISNTAGSSEVYDLYDKLITLLDEASLMVSGYTCVRMHRLSASVEYYPEDKIWQYTCRYHILIYKR